MNELTDEIYGKLSIRRFDGGAVPTQPMFLTGSSFEVRDHGQAEVDAFGAPAGLRRTEGPGIQFLVFSAQDSRITTTTIGNRLGYILDAFKPTALSYARDLVARHWLAPFGAGA